MSCLFDSLSKFSSNCSSNELRTIICDYLIQNPTLIDNLKADEIIYHESNKNLQRYVDSMRLSSTWGGSIEIKSFCNIFNINVIVINIRDNNERIEFLSNDDNCKKYIEITWSGGHFEANQEKRLNR